MKQLNRFEFNLLKILYSLLGRVPYANALPLIAGPCDRPRPFCLSRDCVELIESALRRGSVTLLSKAGAWKVESFLRNESIKSGRLWERTPPEEMGLSFSRATLEILCWLTEECLPQTKKVWKPQSPTEITLGDQFVFYLVLKMLRSRTMSIGICKSLAFRESGLACLAFPEAFADAKVAITPDFEPWVQGTGSFIIEALQDVLVDYWVELETEKKQIVSRERVLNIGRAQTRALEQFIEAATQAGRTDLCRFLMQLLNVVATPNATSADWIKNITMNNIRVADRTETYMAALSVHVAAQRIAEINTRFSTVSYIDEDYDASQLWKQNWEAYHGAQSITNAERIVAEVTF